MKSLFAVCLFILTVNVTCLAEPITFKRGTKLELKLINTDDIKIDRINYQGVFEIKKFESSGYTILAFGELHFQRMKLIFRDKFGLQYMQPNLHQKPLGLSGYIVNESDSNEFDISPLESHYSFCLYDRHPNESYGPGTGGWQIYQYRVDALISNDRPYCYVKFKNNQSFFLKLDEDMVIDKR